jgi:hypothetical protein
MKKTLLLLAFCAIAAFAGDATGKWSGSFNVTRGSETKEATAFMVLTQDGGKITGTAGPNADEQFPIKSGAIAGDKIQLVVQPHEGPEIAMTLTLDGDRLTGEAKGEHEGEKLSAKLDLKREK